MFGQSFILCHLGDQRFLSSQDSKSFVSRLTRYTSACHRLVFAKQVKNAVITAYSATTHLKDLLDHFGR